MELSFSRGFTPGWLEGNDHKRLVPGLRAAKQGIVLGEVDDVRPDSIRVRIGADVSLGDGLAIASPHAAATSDSSSAKSTNAYAGSGFADNHQGGRIYSLSPATGRDQNGKLRVATAGDEVWIGFGRGDVDTMRLEPGAEVFKNDDPELNKKLSQSFGGKPRRTRPIDFEVVAVVGQPLRLTGRLDGGVQFTFVSPSPLEVARRHAITDDVLTDKLGRLGGTIFHLSSITSTIHGEPMVPLGLLNESRREVVDGLFDLLGQPPQRTVCVDAGRKLIERLDTRSESPTAAPEMSVLCRTVEQLRAAIEAGADLVIADFHDVRHHREAVQIARSTGAKIFLASIRIQKPKEMGLLKQIVKYAPDGILARNLAAIDVGLKAGLKVVADFSLNVANHRSAEWLIDRGVDRVTTSYDLNADQLDDLVKSTPAHWLETVMHQHMPMFHMEHCVFCSVMSPGTNKTNCGRPCDRHVVQLRDRVGKLHTLQADIACRNTLYNATPQSAADVIASLIEHGIRWFRVELLEEAPPQVMQVLKLYRQLLCGQASGADVWRTLAAENRVGVTRGTLEAKRNPLAIL
jgi:putative protease